MVICPKCKAEITSLEMVVKEKNIYTYRAGNNFGSPDCISFDVQYFKCPKCFKRLKITPDSDSADEFLSEREGANANS